MRRLSCLTTLLLLLLLVGAVTAGSREQSNLFQAFLNDVHLDMEILADRVFAGTRPEGWISEVDLASSSVLADIFYDNELLADEIFGVGVRPLNWIGASTRNTGLISRNIRHDLELSADEFLAEGNRPEGWVGAPAIYQCSRTIQNILNVLILVYGVRSNTPDAVFDYCTAVAAEIDDQLLPSILGTAVEDADFQGLIWAVRGDLERLADETQGLGIRPPSWIGNTDLNSPDLAPDTLSDMERLADVLLGQQIRPDGWNGTISSSLSVSYRNLRQDLELLADATPQIGEGVRPNGWQGIDPLVRCDPNVQNLVLLVQINYRFTIDPTLINSASFCEETEKQANNMAENPPIASIEEEEENRFRYESQIAFTYLDAAATDYMGMMPLDTEFRAWYRNFNGSTMMFVSGENFAVYLDRRWTNMPQDVFDTLPTLEGVKPLAFCDANWCNGPAPTPTPTGDGPLLDIIRGVTPQPTIPAGGGGEVAGKTGVSWNHIRVNYLLQRPELGVAQVSLEICNDVSQVACEPVISIFNNNTGVAYPVISQFNGLNVYELPYGYSTNLLIEGTNFFSTDIWLNDPTLLTPIATSQTSTQGNTSVIPSGQDDVLTCNAAASCDQITTCEQAQACYRLGNTSLDGDGDGVPCEAICGT